MALDLKAAFGQNLQDGFTIHQHPFLTRLIARLRENFSVPVQLLFDPVDERSGVAMIGKQMDQTGKASNQLLQEQPRSITITDIGSMDQDRQDQALRIDEQVSFATEDFFSRRQNRVRCLARGWF